MIKPFRNWFDFNNNQKYEFLHVSDRNLEKEYLVTIILDLEDNIIYEFCDCDGYNYKKSCKHIKQSKKILKEFGVEFHEPKTKRD